MVSEEAAARAAATAAFGRRRAALAARGAVGLATAEKMAAYVDAVVAATALRDRGAVAAALLHDARRERECWLRGAGIEANAASARLAGHLAAIGNRPAPASAMAVVRRVFQEQAGRPPAALRLLAPFDVLPSDDDGGSAEGDDDGSSSAAGDDSGSDGVDFDPA